MSGALLYRAAKPMILSYRAAKPMILSYRAAVSGALSYRSSQPMVLAYRAAEWGRPRRAIGDWRDIPAGLTDRGSSPASSHSTDYPWITTIVMHGLPVRAGAPGANGRWLRFPITPPRRPYLPGRGGGLEPFPGHSTSSETKNVHFESQPLRFLRNFVRPFICM